MSDTSDLPLEQWITLEYQDRIAIITINRPDKLNALPKDGFYRITQCLREIETHDEVLVTLLTGKGRFFCAYVTQCIA